MKRLMAPLLASALALGACGGSELEVGAGEATTTTRAVAEASAATTTTTAAPTTTTAPPVERSDDELAITEAYAVAFNSESTFDDTAPYLVAPDGLEDTVAGYRSIGTQMGGVSVEIESIAIDGVDATLTYTLLFGGNPTYTGLSGSAVLTDAGWQIGRDMFCGLMSSARVGCPDA